MNDRLLLNDFIHFVEKEKLFQPKDVLLLAVSGGVDSVVLCELCKLAGYPFVIAHCNFNLRGNESDEDEKFVKKLAAHYQSEVLVKSFNTNVYAEQHKTSIQVAARELRYSWFYDILSGIATFNTTTIKNLPKYILTAHHSDDNIETVLMNFFKGTGISGMRGMLPKISKIVRPLLFATKAQLQEFAVSRQLAYREDSSNSSDKYSRNYFRHQVLPLVQKIYPGAAENIVSNIHRFRETEYLYHHAIEQYKKHLLDYRNNEVYIPVRKLMNISPLHSVLYEITKQYDFTPGQVNDIVSLLQSESGKFVQSDTYRILKNRNWLIISPLAENHHQIKVIESGTDIIHFANGSLTFKEKKSTGEIEKIPALANTAFLDMNLIHYPLLLRKWQAGDYFYPLGMTKKKKLSRFFIDKKLSLTEKEKVWVLEMNKKIIWVINNRIDDRFKITNNTKAILQINFHPY
ncbi:MAG: tRNA lysidine(34) synthetase TilS [Bacteroidetes bacterium]|nr:tRNA lysidine(34) synthetase TilS [Bacteroidota bacterium]